MRNPISEPTGTARVETEVLVRPLEAPTEAEITELAGLFDQYRAHYGQAIQAGQSASWLRHNLRSGRLTAFIAEMQGELIGFAVTMDVPASLRLGLKGSTIRITPPSDTRGSDRRARPFVRPAFGSSSRPAVFGHRRARPSAVPDVVALRRSERRTP